MAKKGKKPIEEPIVEEVIEEVVEEPIIEETAESTVNADDFFTRTLKAINKMENPAKAERLANRLLRKRR